MRTRLTPLTLLALGLLVLSSSFLLRRLFSLPDWFAGVLAGVGIGFEIAPWCGRLSFAGRVARAFATSTPGYFARARPYISPVSWQTMAASFKIILAVVLLSAGAQLALGVLTFVFGRHAGIDGDAHA